MLGRTSEWDSRARAFFMNGRVHFGCLLFMIIFSAHRKQIRDFVTYATSFLFIALHFGFAGRLLAQSIDDGAPVITSPPTLPLCMPLQILIVKGLKDQTVYEGDQIDLNVFVCDGGGTSGGVYWQKKMEY